MFESWKKGYWDLITRFSPPPTDSLFYEKGTLTPHEYVVACDQLIEVNPIWKWGQAKTLNGVVEFLPKDKQYIYADIISRYRINKTKINKPDDSLSNEGGIKEHDLAEQLEQLELQDSPQEPDIRYYRAYITYDLYYHTPWFWLGGSDEQGNPLTKEQIFEEIMNDYVNKTATQEKCLQVDKNLVFIHPCRHAEVIKNLVNKAVSNEKNITVNEYMFIFLKFISSVMPGLELDFTMDIEL